MTINLTPHPQDALTPANAQPVMANPLPHIFVGSAIVIVAIAFVLLLAIQVELPVEAAIASGVAFVIGAGWLHVKIAAPSPQPVAERKAPTLDSPRVKKRARSETDKAEPIQAMAATASPTVEPSDLALVLLASLRGANEPAATPPPQDDSWSWAIAAHLEQPRAQAAQTASEDAPLVAAPFEMETEVQRVERLVKRLADNVNQLQAMREAKPAAAPLIASQAAPYQDAQQLPLFPEPEDPGQQLEASINALRRANASATAALPPMHAAAPAAVVPVVAAPEPAPIVDATPAVAWTKAPVPVAIDPHAASQRNSILSALNEQRIDVFLEPILDLSEQRPQHYEVSIALRTYGGHTIDLTQAANDLSGTGLLPLIDQARIARAANIARRLAERGKTGAVFTEMSGETLDDGGFQETFANDTISVGAFPGQLVLTLPQAHVVTFTTADWRTLGRLREAGFGFALSDVTTLDMDFARLAQVGFVFARLDAETFLIGLPTAGGIVPPADICRHLAQCGLMLIVGGIVEDHQLARIFGFGVLFGQGQLFGGARPMKSEAASNTANLRYPDAPASHA